MVGILLLLLGAASASAASRTLEEKGRVRWLPAALVPSGVLIGAGGAVARGWELWGSMAAGAVVVPLAGMGMVLLQRRRARRSP